MPRVPAVQIGDRAVHGWNPQGYADLLGVTYKAATQLPPRELAHLMAEATSQEGFITAYWRQYKDQGITPQDFFEFYSALETLLEQDGIKVYRDTARPGEAR